MKSEISIKAAIYLRAAELVEIGHCKSIVARNAAGRATDPEAADAASWCAWGALSKATQEYGNGPYTIPAFSELTDSVGGSVPAWNNAPERTAAEVAAKFREQAFKE